MRQLQVQVRDDQADRVMQLASEHGAPSPVVVPGRRLGADGWSVVQLHLPNDRVGGFMEAIEGAEEMEAVLFPQGVLPLQAPLSTLADRVKSVAPRSTLELTIGTLQSIGSWRGLLFYAAFSGLLAAYAVIFNVVYLLVAAMLIAPMGAPAMVSVIGTAIGDWKVVAQGALRFFSALLVLVGSAVGLGYAYQLSVVSNTMVDITSFSTWSVLLALVGGAAGAQAQVQSDRDSLVSGTTAGFLVAVALSPPAAVLGLSIVLGHWPYAGAMAFLLILTFVGIITGGWLLLMMYGVRPSDASASRGSTTALVVLAAATLLATVGLVSWQTQLEPRFQKADLSHQAVNVTRDVVQRHATVTAVDVRAGFVPAGASPSERLLVTTVVEATDTTTSAAAEDELRQAIRNQLTAHMTGVSPFVDITVLPP